MDPKTRKHLKTAALLVLMAPLGVVVGAMGGNNWWPYTEPHLYGLRDRTYGWSGTYDSRSGDYSVTYTSHGFERFLPADHLYVEERPPDTSRWWHHPATLPGGYPLDLRASVPPTPDQLHDLTQRLRTTWSHLEKVTGRPIDGGLDLTLIHMTGLPASWSAHQTLDSDDPHAQVFWTFVLEDEVEPGTLGPEVDDALDHLLIHELGHHLVDDALVTHDFENTLGPVTWETRWFLEGLCEWLALSYTREGRPDSYRGILETRHVGTVLADPQLREGIWTWSDHNDETSFRDVDAYGASLLILELWTRHRPLADILIELEALPRSAVGTDLRAMITRDLGMSLDAILDAAHALGVELAHGES